jgi:hypothetical protein
MSHIGHVCVRQDPPVTVCPRDPSLEGQAREKELL